MCDKVHKQIKAIVESRDPVSGNNLKVIFLGKMFNQVLPLNLQPYNTDNHDKNGLISGHINL